MSQRPLSRAACTLAVLALLGSGAPGHAASSASSAVSDSVGTLSNSLSTSLNKSSDSSKTKNVAQGDYDVIEVVALDDSAAGDTPGRVRVRLQSVADAGPAGLWYLTLPQAVWQRAALGAGQRVAATPRPYGVAFARADTREAFFLVLADDWQRELDPRPVSM